MICGQNECKQKKNFKEKNYVGQKHSNKSEICR